MQIISKKTEEKIDELVFAKYPNAEKVAYDLIEDRHFDDFYQVCHYIINKVKDADELGFNENIDEQVVVLTFAIHDISNRIFFWLTNNFGDPNNKNGESDGEFENDELVWKVGSEQEVLWWNMDLEDRYKI